MKKFLKAVIIIVAAIVIIGGGMYTYVTWGMDRVLGETVRPADLNALSDGTYEGSYQNARWSNKVAVTVSGGRITGVEVLEDVKIPLKDVTEQLTGRVLEKQNIDVDVISSATATCNAYLKAMENALNK